MATLSLKRASPAKGGSSLQGVLTARKPGGGEIRALEVDLPVKGLESRLLQMLLFAFVGGLILNLMPCVFPVISIKVLSFASQAGQDRRRTRMLSLVFAAGVLVSFWILTALLLSWRTAGEQLGWGFQLQAPGFLVLLEFLFFLLALNLLGVFEIGAGLMAAGSGLAARGGYAGSFFSGVLATVIATPCSAPFMGAAVGFALTQPPAICLLIFTSLALGMAAPYLLLAFFPSLIGFLPRPGRWMESLKQFFAFPLLATVLWLIWTLEIQVGIGGVLYLLAGLLTAGLGLWIVGRWQGVRLARALGWLVVMAGAVLSYQGVAPRMPGATAESGIEWRKFSPEAVEQARQSGKPVFVDFTAAWCISCQVNERLVFSSADVQKRFKELGIAAFKADWTNRDEAITRALESLGRSGVPVYVLYDDKKGSSPQLLPEVITPGIVLDRLAALPAPRETK
jgi:thiol:disulfide interchange protein DsbD